MIKYTLQCKNLHQFESWFRTSDDYDKLNNKKMLSWPRGPHPDDGVWGRVWYENTNKSTCFIQQTNKEILLSDYQKSIVDSAYTYYEKLESFKQEFL